MMSNSDFIEMSSYDRYMDMLRFIFVPSIDRRIVALLQYCIYGNESYDTILQDLKAWFNSEIFTNALRTIDRLSGIVVDSVLMNNRIQLINRMCEHVDIREIGFEINFNNLFDYFKHLKYWISQIITTFLTTTEACNEDNLVPRGRNSRKRKVSRDDEIWSSSDSSNDSLDSLPSCLCLDVSSPYPGGKKRSYEPRLQCNKLKLIVNKMTTDIGCHVKDRPLQVDYVNLPCEPEAIKEKIFKNSRPSEKLNECLKRFCIQLNDVINRLQNDVVNNLNLFCDIRNNYVYFKLGDINSETSKFATKVLLTPSIQENLCKNKFISQSCSKTNLRKKFTVCTTKSFATKFKTKNLSRNGVNSTKGLSKTGGRSCGTTSCNQDSTNEDNFIFKCQLDKEDCNNDNYSSNSVSINDDKKCYCGCKYEASAHCNHSKSNQVLKKFKDNIELIKKNLRSSNSNAGKNIHAYYTKKELQDIGVITEKIILQPLSGRNNQINTEDVADSSEVRNVYINDIFLCYCNTDDNICNCFVKNIDRMITEIGINIESVKNNNKNLKVSVDISTNTSCTELKENTIQGQTCIQSKKFKGNIDITLSNKKLHYNCNKEKCQAVNLNQLSEKEIPKKNYFEQKTYFEGIVQSFNELPLSAELIDHMQSKLRELATISAEIHEKCMVMSKKELNSCFDWNCNTKPFPENLNIEIKLETSLVSLAPKSNNSVVNKKFLRIKSTTSEESLENISRIKRSCNSSLCKYKKLIDCNARLKKSTYTKINSPTNNLSSRTCELIYQHTSFNSTNSRLFSCYGRYSLDDTMDDEKFHNRTFKNRRRKSIRHALKILYFINNMSYQFTRQVFIKCKQILRYIFKNIIKKGKMLNDYRKFLIESRCCSDSCKDMRNCCEAKFFDESNFSNALQFSDYYARHNQNNLATRLSGGDDAYYRDRKRLAKECDHGFLINVTTTDLTRIRSICRDLNYYKSSKVKDNYMKQKSLNIKKSLYRKNKLMGRESIDGRIKSEDY